MENNKHDVTKAEFIQLLKDLFASERSEAWAEILPAIEKRHASILTFAEHWVPDNAVLIDQDFEPIEKDGEL